jgi:hypothetical protein
MRKKGKLLPLSLPKNLRNPLKLSPRLPIISVEARKGFHTTGKDARFSQSTHMEVWHGNIIGFQD